MTQPGLVHAVVHGAALLPRGMESVFMIAAPMAAIVSCRWSRCCGTRASAILRAVRGRSRLCS
jgi:hypothetical protein